MANSLNSPAPSRPLKILQVGSGFPSWGGTELHLLNLSEQLAARGHQVTISCRPGRFVEEQAKKRNIPTASITVKRQWDWSDAKAIRTLIKQERFDVVHVHWSTDYLVTPAIARMCRVPVVLMSRHSPYRLQSAVGRFLYKRVLFDRIIALSESVRRTLLGQNIPADHVVTIHHGTDTQAFARTTQSIAEVRAEWGIPADAAFVVGMVGRVALEKGVLTFLNAFAQIKIPNAYAVIVGDGAQKEEATALAETLGIQNRLIWAGFRDDVNNAINALDTLVLASVWEEPCSAVVQQAMALSKPVVGTNLGGTPEMIAANETGLLVPPGDSSALADALTLLAGDASRRATMGARGKERIEALFTLTGMVDKIESLYHTQIALRDPKEATALAAAR